MDVPIQQQLEFPPKPGQVQVPAVSTPLHVLLKPNHCLDGDVADGEAEPSVSHQLGQVSVLQYFLGTAGSMEHQYMLREAKLSREVLATVA